MAVRAASSLHRVREENSHRCGDRSGTRSVSSVRFFLPRDKGVRFSQRVNDVKYARNQRKATGRIAGIYNFDKCDNVLNYRSRNMHDKTSIASRHNRFTKWPIDILQL